MKLLLVRHGDAFAGLRGVIAGTLGCRGSDRSGPPSGGGAARLDPAPTPDFRVDVLITSTLPRAIETASIIAPALGFDEVPEDCDLCEVHTGEADGLEWAEYSTRFGNVDMLAQPHRPFAPGGDSWNGFHDRVGTVMDRLASEHPGSTVMAVCHSGVIAASMRVRFGTPLTGGPRLVPTNTGVTEWDHDDATRQLDAADLRRRTSSRACARRPGLLSSPTFAIARWWGSAER